MYRNKYEYNTSNSFQGHFQNLKFCILTSWISSSLGILMVFFGLYIIVWNEMRALEITQSLDEAMNAIIIIDPFSLPSEENNGALVYLSGTIEVGEPLTELEYGISVPAVKLKRRVQMFQWVEEELESYRNEQYETATSFSYNMDWREKLVDSSLFHDPTGHFNPREFPIKSVVYVNEYVSIGNYIFGSALKEKFNDFIIVTSDERPERKDIKLHSQLYYHSHDVWNPEVGDVRIQFSYAGKSGDMVTIIAMQVGNKLIPYKTMSGEEVLILGKGYLLVEDMFSEGNSNNWILIWFLRGFGWFLQYLGINCLIKSILQGVRRYLIQYLLFLGVNSINVTASATFSILSISLVWVWYKPFLGLFLFGSSFVPIMFGYIKITKQKLDRHRHQKL